MGMEITLSSVQLLTKPVMEHQFNVINDFAEEIAFRNFVKNNQRTLIDGFPIQLEVDSTNNLVFLQWCVEFTGVEHVASFQVFHTATRYRQVQIFINTQRRAVVVAKPHWLRGKLFTGFKWVHGFEETEAPG